MYLTNRLDERAIFSPGAGKVVSSEYESVSVQLKRQLTSEAGTITITTPPGLVTGQELLVDVSFLRIIDHSLDKCYCDRMETIKIVIPSPLPVSPANYIADYIRKHPAISSSIVSSVAANVISYSVITPGSQLEISSTTPNLVAKAITQIAANGQIANVGDGSAVFYTPQENKMLAGIRSLFGSLGSTSATPIPFFFGVRRAYDKIQNVCEPRKDECCEVVRRGTIHIPLESLAPATLPASNLLGVVARFSPDGSFTKTGGFRIVDNTAIVPNGCLEIPSNRIEVIAIAPDRKTALIRLF